MTLPKKLSKQEKEAIVLAIQQAFNMKSITYVDVKYNVRASHNYTGVHIFKVVYKNNIVTIYDVDNKEIGTQEGAKPKVEQKAKPAKQESKNT